MGIEFAKSRMWGILRDKIRIPQQTNGREKPQRINRGHGKALGNHQEETTARKIEK